MSDGVSEGSHPSLLPTPDYLTPSPMDVWSIASGSSGNAYLARAEGTTVLVECGIPLSRITPS